MQIAQPPLAPPIAPFRGENHQVERVRLLDLQPALPARSRSIGRADRLRHDAFIAAIERLPQKLGAFSGSAVTRCGTSFRPARARKRREAPYLRLVDHRLAVEIQQVEPIRCQRQFGAHAVEIELAAETFGGHLERLRTAIGVRLMISPSTIRSRPGSARTASTISGLRP